MTKKFLIKSDNHSIDLYVNDVLEPQKIVLCIHGFTGNFLSDGFSELMNNLKNTLVCSFDSAGHGESRINSLDMRLNIINNEIYDVLTFLSKKYIDVPILIFANSYGAYTTVTTLAKCDFPCIRHIIFINPAFKMLDVLQKLRNFDYFTLDKNATIPMKLKLNKFLSKDFLDDLYENNVYNMNLILPDTTIFIGTQDTLITLQDTLDFAKIYNCKVIYIEDTHSIKNNQSWQKITEYIGELK